jgi:hypothetical protein
MSSLTEIILLLFAPGVVSSAILLLAAGYVAYSVFDHMEIFFLKSGRPFSILEGTATITCIAIAVASILVCPLAAYYGRNIIFEYTHRDALQVTLFALTASSQIIILGTFYYSVVLLKKYRAIAAARKREKEEAAFLEYQKKLKEIDIKIAIVNATVLKEGKTFAITDFKLRILNIPLLTKSFTIYWKGDETFKLSVFSPRVPDKVTKGGMIRATWENEGWVFRENTSDAVISNDPMAIPVKVLRIRDRLRGGPPPKVIPVQIYLVQSISTGESHRVLPHLVRLIRDFDPDPRKA